MSASADREAIVLMIQQFFGAFDNREGRNPDESALIALFHREGCERCAEID